jgi:F-type H+-transporting ATPase subunit alpha
LQELLKQPQYSPLPLNEQVAILYAGINGYLDDIPVEKISTFTRELREYLRTSKPQYGELVQNQKQLNEEAEKLLKEAIAESKQTLMATA